MRGSSTHVRNGRTRIISIAAVILACGALYGLLYVLRQGAPGEVRVVTASGETHIWRFMQPEWRFRLPLGASYRTGAPTLRRVGQRLYWLTRENLGCLDTRTGKQLWTLPVMERREAGQDTAWDDLYQWSLTADEYGAVATAEVQHESGQSPPPPPARIHLVAVRSDGAPLWSRRLPHKPAGQAQLTPTRVIVPGNDGTLYAMDRTTGQIAWTYRPHSNMEVQTSGSAVVLRLGNETVQALDALSGDRIWRYPDRSVAPSETGAPRFAIADLGVYACLAGSLVALRLDNGRPIWRRQIMDGSGDYMVVAAGGHILLDAEGDIVEVAPQSGRTGWHLRTSIDSDRSSWTRGFSIGQPTRLGSGTPSELLMTGKSRPLINGEEADLVSLRFPLDTVMAIQPATGRELWRWQPWDGSDISDLQADERCLFVSGGDSITAYTPGPANAMPSSVADRRALAEDTLKALTSWSEHETPRDRLSRHLPVIHLPGSPEYSSSQVDQTAAALALLRLGHESTAALLAYVKHALLTSPTNEFSDFNMTVYGWWALNLLVDIDDRTAVPVLTRDLDTTRDATARASLASALIRLGDVRAAAALFRYACDESGESSRRLDALHFVCRAQARQPTPGVAPQEVTNWLIARMGEKRTPWWLRGFARFELLNGRGERARNTSLNSFYVARPSPIIPPNTVMRATHDEPGPWDASDGFPRKVKFQSWTRDGAGKYWAVFQCGYIEDATGLWIAQSDDGRTWRKPAFALDPITGLSAGHYPGNVSISASGNTLRLAWEIQAYPDGRNLRTVGRRSARFTVGDLYRDSDGDGLPDRLERTLGTDPNRADTNGDGVTDGLDLNPTTRPHRLTDEEAIYQAAVEAVCQDARGRQEAGQPNGATGVVPGISHSPLLLALPPGSAGITITGHPGHTIQRSSVPTHGPRQLLTASCMQFTRPTYNLDGTENPPDRGILGYLFDSPPHDPFAPVPVPKERPPAFRDLFPYQLSSDGERARVGYTYRTTGFTSGLAKEPTLDIELRKINGRWYAVEVRDIEQSFSYRARRVVVPIIRSLRRPAGS